MPGPAAELGLGTVVAAARLKVLASLPGELRARASRLVERFHLDATAWFSSSDPVPHLATLADAVWEARRATIGYRRGGDSVDRKLDPIGLVLKAGVWYLVAGIGRPDPDLSGLALHRVAVTTTHFERPADFDLPAYWRSRRPPTSRPPRGSRSPCGSTRRCSGGWRTPSVEQAVRDAERLPATTPTGGCTCA